jgi:hypothetical protein
VKKNFRRKFSEKFPNVSLPIKWYLFSNLQVTHSKTENKAVNYDAIVVEKEVKQKQLGFFEVMSKN